MMAIFIKIFFIITLTLVIKYVNWRGSDSSACLIRSRQAAEHGNGNLAVHLRSWSPVRSVFAVDLFSALMADCEFVSRVCPPPETDGHWGTLITGQQVRPETALQLNMCVYLSYPNVIFKSWRFISHRIWCEAASSGKYEHHPNLLRPFQMLHSVSVLFNKIW